MSLDHVRIELLPLGANLQVKRGTPLQDVLFAHGVEFPCGGRGLGKGCRIKLIAGSLPVTPEDKHKLTIRELEEGWRLACRAKADTDLRVELAQWESAILTDNSDFSFTPRQGMGVAVDLGTTTLVAQLVDLQTGHVLAVKAALNTQATHGADIMSRIEFAVSEKGQNVLQTLIRDQIGQLVAGLLRESGTVDKNLASVVIVGNTVMHHLFCGISVAPLSEYPFETPSPELQVSFADDIGWKLPGNPRVHFLPCLGGFVGSDILAGVLATKLHEAEKLVTLIDLGTNGELVVGTRDRMLCASTAAGPAFEGARISMGMRAATGAISEVLIEDGKLACRILGNGEARGICGSGLVDAVAVGLDLGFVKPSGRFTQGETLPLVNTVALNQWDIRELQLAKGAIAAGLEILLEEWGATQNDVETVYLAGAFGNYINQASAKRIGLLNFPPEKIVPSGNTALLGAKLALFDLEHHHGAYPEILSRITHFSLKEHPRFQDAYVEHMTFPAN